MPPYTDKWCCPAFRIFLDIRSSTTSNFTKIFRQRVRRHNFSLIYFKALEGSPFTPRRRFSRHKVPASRNTQRPRDSVTPQHGNGLYAPRPPRRARRNAPRGYPGDRRYRRRRTKLWISQCLHKVRVPPGPQRQAAILWTLRRGALLQQALCQSRLAGSQARVRERTQATRRGARGPRSAGRSDTRLQSNKT